MKKILLILAGLFLLLCISVFVLIYTFDANDYKKELAGLAETITGRTIDIAGDIDISLYPLIKIKADNISVDNPPGFSNNTFATVDQFDIEIEIKPLLSKRLNIEKLVLNGIAVGFENNASGENNWSNFAGANSADKVESKLGLTGLAIGSVEMVDANMAWVDAVTGKQFKIEKMKLTTEAVEKGQPLPMTFNAYIESSLPDWQGTVFVKTNLVFSADSPVFNADDLKLVVKALLPSSDMENITVAMIADGEINVKTESAKLSKAKLSALGLVMNGELEVENIFSVPVIQGPLKVKTFEAQTLAKQFNFTIPQMENPQSLKNISLTTLFKTDFNSIELDDISAKLDNSSVSGFIHFKDLQKSIISYGLDIDNLNIQDYSVMQNESGKSGLSIPVDLIRSSELEGGLYIETVTIDDIKLNKFHMVSNIGNGVLQAEPISMFVGDSEVAASLKLEAHEVPHAAFTVKSDNVDAKVGINPILKTVMGEKALSFEGVVSANADIQASGMDMDALMKSANGVLNVKMDKGALQGIDLDHASRTIVADYANKNNFRTRRSFVTDYQPDRKTEFNSLSARFDISNGNMVNSDLLLVSDAANITGSGSIDLINGKLDYRPVIDINVDNRVDIRDKLRDHPMEYHAHGVFENLTVKFNYEKYDLLVGRLLAQEAKARRIERDKSGSKSTWQNVRGE